MVLIFSKYTTYSYTFLNISKNKLLIHFIYLKDKIIEMSVRKFILLSFVENID